jgi:hypothetical protein
MNELASLASAPAAIDRSGVAAASTGTATTIERATIPWVRCRRA